MPHCSSTACGPNFATMNPSASYEAAEVSARKIDMSQQQSFFVIAAVKPRERVDRIIEQVQAAEISPDRLSLISPDDRHGRDPSDEKPRENADKLHDSTVGAVTGGVAMG